MNNLVFRRQFILSNKELVIDNNWYKAKLNRISRNFILNIHPDLEYEKTENDDVELILLGYIIDPINPAATSLDVLNEMVLLPDFKSILIRTDTLSGRFTIIYNDLNSIKICNDATGFREVYFYHDDAITACGSTPSILADLLFLPLDGDKDILSFFTSKEFNDLEHRWIGNRTIYKGIFHLSPNHFLDLIEGKIERFWPVERRVEIELEKAGHIMADILTGTFEAAIRRYKLHQGLTGGWDTRVLLAASRNYVDKIYFYFIRGFKSDTKMGNSGDFIISQNISKRYNIPVDVIITKNENIDAEFEGIYYHNNKMARSKLLAVYYDAYQKKLDYTVNVAGTSGNEILRLLSSVDRNISDSKKIAGMLGYGSHPYVVDSIHAWLQENNSLKKLNFKLIDLFNWEQMFFNWGSLSGAEQDIVREELRPYNNRQLISTYISLKDRFRYKDYPLGHVKIIEQLWAELMDFDVDLRHYRKKKILRYFGVEQLTNLIYQRLKKYSKVKRQLNNYF
jgi:hypothetical protein